MKSPENTYVQLCSVNKITGLQCCSIFIKYIIFSNHFAFVSYLLSKNKLFTSMLLTTNFMKNLVLIICAVFSLTINISAQINLAPQAQFATSTTCGSVLSGLKLLNDGNKTVSCPGGLALITVNLNSVKLIGKVTVYFDPNTNTGEIVRVPNNEIYTAVTIPIGATQIDIPINNFSLQYLLLDFNEAYELNVREIEIYESTTTPTPISQVPADNVVAYLPFNNNVSDVSLNKNDGTVIKATSATDRLGKPNAAYYFNGTSSVITLPTMLLPYSNAFSFGCWFKVMGNTGGGTIPGQGLIDIRGQYQISLGYNQNNHPTNPNSVSFYIYSNSTATYITSPNNSVPTIAMNKWTHLMCNYGNNTMELYIDGKLIGSQTSIAPPLAVPTTGPNTIGKDYSLPTNRAWANGCIDEIIIYKRKLTATEIKAIYDRGNSESEIMELYGPLSFNYDQSGNRSSRNVISLKGSKITYSHDSISGDQNAFLAKQDSMLYSDMDQKVKIYPNPTKGLLHTKLTGFDFTQKSGIYVYNSNGILLKEIVPATATDEIDLSTYSNGIYIMRIAVGDKTSEWKIFKE